MTFYSRISCAVTGADISLLRLELWEENNHRFLSWFVTQKNGKWQICCSAVLENCCLFSSLSLFNIKVTYALLAFFSFGISNLSLLKQGIKYKNLSSNYKKKCLNYLTSLKNPIWKYKLVAFSGSSLFIFDFPNLKNPILFCSRRAKKIGTCR